MAKRYFMFIGRRRRPNFYKIIYITKTLKKTLLLKKRFVPLGTDSSRYEILTDDTATDS